MCTLFVLLKRFYSAEENATIVLTKHFDFLCNDKCFACSEAIITINGG